MSRAVEESRPGPDEGARPGRRAPSPRRPAPEAPRRLARELRDLRRACGMTQRRLAARSGVQQAEISRIEAGRSNPTLSTLAALAAALGAELSVAPRGRDDRARRAAAEEPRPPRARADGTGPAAERRKFLCLVCAERLMEQMAPREAERHLARYRAFTERLATRGQLLACNRLLPAETAVTVRVRRGKVSASDGPFAETKELVGGYFVLQARDRAEAVRLAAAIPGARIGCVEVRPIAEDAATLRALGLAPPAAGRLRRRPVDPGGARSSSR